MSFLGSKAKQFKEQFSTYFPREGKPQYIMMAGIDVDGQLRGKFVPYEKIAGAKAPFCSVVFGWDCNDLQYKTELKVSNSDNGYRDLTLVLDADRIFNFEFGEEPSALVLGFFSDEGQPLHSDPRSVLRTTLNKLEGYVAKTGAEIEWYNFSETSHGFTTKDADTALPLTTGMHGYSVLRPQQNAGFWNKILSQSANYNIKYDTFHSETGPGVYECALRYQNADVIADQIVLFKHSVRKIGQDLGITPCFMAKPRSGMPGNSGHLHCSLVDESSNENAFCAPEKVEDAPFPECEYLSVTGQQFLAGLLDGLEDVMLLFAPNVNSYKRLDPDFWAPVQKTWGAENRLASIRLIDAYPGAVSTRFEVRVPGADMIPHFALSAIYGLGYRGIQKKMELKTPPVRSKDDIAKSPLLPYTLADAVRKFEAPTSIARELFGDDFVDHYAGTRKHELSLWNKVVTQWEFKRYLEVS